MRVQRSEIFGVSERVTLPVSVDDAYFYVILKKGSESSFANILMQLDQEINIVYTIGPGDKYCLRNWTRR